MRTVLVSSYRLFISSRLILSPLCVCSVTAYLRFSQRMKCDSCLSFDTWRREKVDGSLALLVERQSGFHHWRCRLDSSTRRQDLFRTRSSCRARWSRDRSDSTSERRILSGREERRANHRCRLRHRTRREHRTSRSTDSEQMANDRHADQHVRPVSFAEKILVSFGISRAAIFTLGFVEDVSAEDWTRVMNVNVRGYALAVKHIVPVMKKNAAGVIVNLASGAGLVAISSFLPYATSKGAIIQLTRNLACDLGPFNIRVNSISPGAIDSPTLDRTAEQNGLTREEFDREHSGKCLRRLGEPQEVANLLVFLLSDLCPFLTGANIVLDGGFTTVWRRESLFVGEIYLYTEKEEEEEEEGECELMFAVSSVGERFRFTDGRIRRSRGGEDELRSMFSRLLNDTHGELPLLQLQLQLLLFFVTFLLFDNGETIVKRRTTSRIRSVSCPSSSSAAAAAAAVGSESSRAENELVLGHGEGQEILSAVRKGTVRWTLAWSVVAVREGQTGMTNVVRTR